MRHTAKGSIHHWGVLVMKPRSILPTVRTACVAAAVIVGLSAAPAAAAALPNHIAGYVVTEAGSADLSGQFIVPTVTCPSADVDFAGTTAGAIAYDAADG